MPPAPHLRPRLRVGLVLRRHPTLRLALVALAALAVGVAVHANLARADAARAAWGEARVVAVAARDLATGQVVDEGDVELVERPLAVVPRRALVDDPVGRTVRSPIVEGEVVVEPRLAGAGERGLAARVPEGQRAVAIPSDPGSTPALEAGQLVDLIVVLPVDAATGDGPPGIVVAADALVVDVADEAVTVAVDEEAAPRVAVALAHGVVTIALAGSE